MAVHGITRVQHDDEFEELDRQWAAAEDLDELDTFRYLSLPDVDEDLQFPNDERPDKVVFPVAT